MHSDMTFWEKQKCFSTESRPVSVPAGGPTTGGNTDFPNHPQSHTARLCAQVTCWAWGPKLTSEFPGSLLSLSASNSGEKRLPSML